MKQKIDTLVKLAYVTCKERKYDKHPARPKLKGTPIPEYPGYIIHIYIYSTEENLFLLDIGKFSKLVQGRVIKSKTLGDIRNPLRLHFVFWHPQVLRYG